MLGRRRPMHLARARRAVGRKGRVALAGALTGAGKFLSNKAQNYVRRKLTNKKSSFQNVKVEGNGGQISRTTMGAKSSKSRGWITTFKKIGTSQFFYNNFAVRITATVGQQGTSTFTHLNANTIGTAAAVPYDLNYMFQMAAGAVLTVSPNQNNTTRILIEDVVSILRLQNQFPGNCEVEIYDIVCKRDNSLTPGQAWATGIQDESNNAGVSQGFYVGIYPQMSALFNVNYKVVKKTRVVLGGGQSHVHYYRHIPNRIMNAEILQNGALNYKGYTTFQMVVASGLPDNDATTKTTVSTSSVALDVVQTKTIKFTYINRAWTQLACSTNLPTSFAVSESVQDQGSGANTNPATTIA